jgi:hypothetical protein
MRRAAPKDGPRHHFIESPTSRGASDIMQEAYAPSPSSVHL